MTVIHRVTARGRADYEDVVVLELDVDVDVDDEDVDAVEGVDDESDFLAEESDDDVDEPESPDLRESVR